MTSVADGLVYVLLGLSAVGCVYLVISAALVLRFVRGRQPHAGDLPPVTILKPLYGTEPDLYDNLRSFCTQLYPQVQVIFGIRDFDDKAISVVERLIDAHPGLDLDLVVDPRIHGTNFKISNLINMLPSAKHPYLVIADSDMHVEADYLRHVVPPLLDPTVGLATCLYIGRPVGGVWSRLGAMFINYGFMPGALVGRATGRRSDCFGATMALRRDTLAKLGGLARFQDQLADDHALGEAVAGLGLSIALPPVIVTTTVNEPSLRDLWQHELRWALTTRLIEPLAFAGSIVTYPTVVSALALLIAALFGTLVEPAGIVFMLALGCRMATVRGIDRTLRLKPSSLWLLPARDLLSTVILVASYCVKSVEWRGRAFRVAPDGHLTLETLGK